MKFLFRKSSTPSQRLLTLVILLSYISLSLSSPKFLANDTTVLNSSYHEPGSSEFNTALGIAGFLVLMAGVCSGLNVGFLSIDQVALKVKLLNGTEKEKKGAKAILAILENHHLLLSTLLVANALAMEALPIYLHEIIPAAMAVLVSTVVVVIFGEILPQAFCTGPKQFEIASFSVPIIKFLELVFLIICYPIAKFLDYLLGKHDSSKFQINKKDLKALIEIHTISADQESDQFQQFGFNKQEVQMLSSTLDLRDQKVTTKMIKLDNVFMLGTHEIFSKELILKIRQSGFSSIPVYDKQDRQNILGCLRTKKILKCERKHLNKPIAKRFTFPAPLMIAKDTNMLQMIELYQKNSCSLAFITDQENLSKQDKLIQSNRDMVVEHFNYIEGIIYLKDLFEEIVDVDFQDDDQHAQGQNSKPPGGKVIKRHNSQQWNDLSEKLIPSQK